jgi:UDP-N-acetylmuramoyl-tripeptide--D-alanyl-D-alanine ligase
MTMTDAASTTCFTPAWIQHVTAGRWLTPPADADATLPGFAIDSRAIRPGQVFLALKGENFDGHAFVGAAIKAGASLAIIDREDAAGFGTDRPQAAGLNAHAATPGMLLVDNTLDALQRLAVAYRELLRKAGCTVIAVVGSNGKTTTRHLIHAVLSARFKGTQSPKSFNNHIGVPLTLLGASLDDRFVVAEVGTNHPGEIAARGDVLRPDAAVVTCIGQEHLEFFGDLRGVAEEEAAISRFVSPDGVIFIERDARKWITEAKSFNDSIELIEFGLGTDGAAQARSQHGDRQRFAISDATTIDLPLLAPHDINNALAAVAVGRWMGMDGGDIKKALERVKPMPGRLEVKHFGPVTVIDDSYNANPDSMRAALDVLKAYPIGPNGRRVAILGDMLELGAICEEAHREVGQTVLHMLDAGVLHHVSLVGPRMADAASIIDADTPGPGTRRDHELNDEVINAIIRSLRPGDVILCKGSRGLRLERIMPKVKQRFEDPEKQENRKAEKQEI